MGSAGDRGASFSGREPPAAPRQAGCRRAGGRGVPPRAAPPARPSGSKGLLGNALDKPATLASLQCAVHHLKVKVLVVLGHELCGAVKAAQIPVENLEKGMLAQL